MFRRFVTPNSFRFSSSSANTTSFVRFAGSTASSSSKGDGQPNIIKQHYSDEEIKKVVKALEADPELAIRVVSNLTPAARRQLVVAGSAFEWFGGQRAAQSEVRAADADQDQVISTKDFDLWFEKALARRAQEQQEAEGKGEKKSSSSTAAATAAGGATAALSFSALFLLGLEAGLPFVGFGFLDNAVMILAGDVIDRSVGFFLGCSVLASAAMGNVVSGMMGMQLHGSIERLVHFFKLPIPTLTDEQRKSKRVFFAGHIGGTIGIATGLTLGMLPLLFLSDKEAEGEARAFKEIDTNKDGKLTAAELKRALNGAGVQHELTDEMTVKLVHKYGDEKFGTLNHDQFHRLCVDLKAKGPLALNVHKLVE
jgi:hypothetical protein